jgi:hypothetical protein
MDFFPLPVHRKNSSICGSVGITIWICGYLSIEFLSEKSRKESTSSNNIKVRITVTGLEAWLKWWSACLARMRL